MRVLSASVIGAGLALFGILAFVQLRDGDRAAIYQENPPPPADLAQTDSARTAAEKRLADAMAMQINNWPEKDNKAQESKLQDIRQQPAQQQPTVIARAEPDPSPATTGSIPAPLATPGMSATEQAALLTRVSALLRQGDIGAARAVLNRLVREDNAKAAFMLAQSYDPQVLRQGKVVGMRPDVPLARDLYQKALRGGVTEAKAALDALPAE